MIGKKKLCSPIKKKSPLLFVSSAVGPPLVEAALLRRQQALRARVSAERLRPALEAEMSLAVVVRARARG